MGANHQDILEAINRLDGHDNTGNMRLDGNDYHVNLEVILAKENAKDTVPNDATECLLFPTMQRRTPKAREMTHLQNDLKISGESPPSYTETNGVSAKRPYLRCKTLLPLPETRGKEDESYTPVPENKEGDTTSKKMYASTLVDCRDSTSPSLQNQEGRQTAAGAGTTEVMCTGRHAGTEGAVISAVAGTCGGANADVAKAGGGAAKLAAIGGKVGGDDGVDQQPPFGSHDIKEKGAGETDRDSEWRGLDLNTPSFIKF
ncbi:hypothetical protein SASPL_133508 [Salvia splendens]|uniref:Uncharacterized protein n=1 Tax=Salvia splendens TaxID=180675 RepID=A0A8X8ZJ68_SALSN|nr:hypothetical protein SASPL_133508 [Salvia splendens]